MSILITGIDMPTKGNPITVLIYPDGTAEWEAQNKVGTAIPALKHGKLIDADALEEYFVNDPSCLMIFDAITKLQGMPTVIPAEEDE